MRHSEMVAAAFALGAVVGAFIMFLAAIFTNRYLDR